MGTRITGGPSVGRPAERERRADPLAQRRQYLPTRLDWTYYVPPTVSSLQLMDGPASGGHQITVRGDGFLNLPGAGSSGARCRFGQHVTRVVEIRNASFLVCDAPSDHAARDATLALPLPPHRPDRPAAGIGDDARFEIERSGAHCCAAGDRAARVGGGSGYNSRAECEASCVDDASCRFFSYAAALYVCDHCSSCVNESSVDQLPSVAADYDVDDAQFESYRRIEPPLPSLLPFSLSLNGQQYELSDADRTCELGYLMYAATVFNVSISGGPLAGGTLVTVTGRGFARAAARASSAPRRFGTFWWHRNASLPRAAALWAATASRQLCGQHGAIQLRDDEIVCPTPLSTTEPAGTQAGWWWA